MARPKRPRDPSQLAKLIVDLATGEAQDDKESVKAGSGRLGGLKGGKTRAERLTASERKEIAKKAAKARWSK